METAFAFVIGGLVAASVYLLLQRNLLKLMFGLVLLSNAANLLIFTVGRLTRGAAPLIPESATVPPGAIANPLPQAMILTAIVISFGLLAFGLVLVYRANQTLGTVDSDLLAGAAPASDVDASAATVDSSRCIESARA